MAQIARQLRDEIARMCARQMAVRAIMQPDFEDLGSVLHISRDFLLENRSEIVRPTALLCAKAISGPIVIGESCRVVLMIEKAAECPTEIVSVKVRAPAGTLRSPSAKILEFRRNESGVEKLELEVCARVAPYCPLEVIFTLDAQATEFAPPPIPVILNVERP